MNWLDKLERRFGAWAVPHFALFIVMSNGLIYLLAQRRPEFLYRLLLDPDAIRHGEVCWRAVTFLFCSADDGPALDGVLAAGALSIRPGAGTRMG